MMSASWTPSGEHILVCAENSIHIFVRHRAERSHLVFVFTGLRSMQDVPTDEILGDVIFTMDLNSDISLDFPAQVNVMDAVLVR